MKHPVKRESGSWWSDKDLRICLVAYILTGASWAWAHDTGPEFIDSFDTSIEIERPGSLAIRHVIDVHPHGDRIRRGLFFELPDQIGPLSAFSATLDGNPIDLEFDDGAIIVAAAAPLERHVLHRFTLNYRAESPWWLESQELAHLRWAPVIEQFELAWASASLQVLWPQTGPAPDLPDHGAREANRWWVAMRGPVHEQGATERLGSIQLRAATRALDPASVRRYGSDWGWRAALVVAALALVGFLHAAWRAVGRDPELGTVPTRSTPPDGVSPAAARFIERMSYDHTAFICALVSLRIRRVIELSIDASAESMHVARVRAADVALSPGEKAVMSELFKGGDSVVLEPGDTRGAKASEALSKKLRSEHLGRHFVTNSTQRNWGLVFGFVVGGLGLAAVIVQARDELTRDPWALALGFVSMVIAFVAPAVYSALFKAPTRAGIAVKRQIAGLRRYFESGPPIRDERHFIELLPYAVALDAEKAWRERLQVSERSAVDRQVADVMNWYREIERSHETIGAMVPIMAAAAGASTSAGAAAGSGASAGGV